MAEINHFYAEDTSFRSYATDTNWANPNTTDGVGKIAGSNLSPNTKYLIIAEALFGGNTNSSLYHFRLSTADDSNIAARSEGIVEPDLFGSSNFIHWFFVHSFTTDSSPADLQFNFKAGSTATTVKCRYTSLLVIEWDDDIMVENVGTPSGDLSTTTWGSLLASLSGGALPASTQLLILGSCAILVDDTKTNFHVRLYNADGAGTQLTYHTAEGEDIDERRMVGVAGEVTTDATPANINLQAYMDTALDFEAGNHAYLVAIDTSKFEDFEASFSATGQTVTGSPASPSTLANISAYTPSVSGNHLVVGRWNYTSGGNDARCSGGITVGGTDAKGAQIEAYQTHHWDPTDGETVMVMARESISSSSNVILEGGADAGDSDPTSEYEFVAVLNLNLVAAAEDTTMSVLTALIGGI